MTSAGAVDVAPRRFDRQEWRLIVVSFLAISVVFGCSRFAYSTVITPMRGDLVASRETMALLAMANLLGYTLGSVTAATLGSQARRIVVPALVSCTVCLGCLAATSSVTVTLVLLVALGLSSGLAFVSAAGLLSTAFSSDRGRAVGLAMAGVGGGIVLSSGLSAILVSTGSEGWRLVWAATAVYTGAVTLAASQLYPRMKPPAEMVFEPTAHSDVQRVHDRRRWFLFAAYLTWGFGQVIQITLLPEFLTAERGVETGTASLVYGASGLTMVLASPLVGLASDHVGRRVMYGFCLACGVAAVALVIGGRSVPFYLVGSLLFGIPVAGLGALTPSLVADLWRPDQFAAVFGGMTAMFGTIQASGPSVAALSIARTGSLTQAYVGSLVLCVIALVSVAGLPSARRSRTDTVLSAPPVI